jgi:2-dehydro-3-deoxyglucarate aldolase
MDFENYKKWAEQKSIVIVQIEHIQAVKNMEKILKVAGVDGFIIGPYDLSASIGKPGEFDAPEVKNALRTVNETAMRLSALPGFHVVPPDIQQVRQKITQGYKFIAYSLDTLFIAERVNRDMEIIRTFQ